MTATSLPAAEVAAQSADGGAAARPSETDVRLRDLGSCTVVRDRAVVSALTTRPEHSWRPGGTT